MDSVQYFGSLQHKVLRPTEHTHTPSSLHACISCRHKRGPTLDRWDQSQGTKLKLDVPNMIEGLSLCISPGAPWY